MWDRENRNNGITNDNRGRGGSYRGGRGNSRRGHSTGRPAYSNRIGDNPEDLRGIMADMAKTIASLTDRLEAIQQGQSKKNDDRQQPPKEKNPETARSNNEDFPAVCKAMYRIVQIQHHIGNWQQLPKRINERLTSLATDVRPPKTDDDFRAAVNSLTDQFGTKLRTLVTEHLQKVLAETETAAGTLRPVDVERAKDIAAKYLRGRLGRLDDAKRRRMMDEAAAMIGINRPGCRPTSPPPHREVAPPWQQVTNKASRKRTAPDDTPPAVATRNRYDVLTSNDDRDEDAAGPEDDDDDATIMDHQSIIASPSQPTPAVKKHRPSTATDVFTGAGVDIFTGPKDEWNLLVDDDTEVAVVGDSNLRPVTRIPPKWQVFSLAGARLTHVGGAIRRLKRDPSKPITVVIQAGINHRLDDATRMQIDLDELRRDIASNNAVQDFYIAGLSTPVGLPKDEASNVNAFNSLAVALYGEEKYIEQIDARQVRISMNDRYGIHHTTETANEVVESMYNVVNCRLNESFAAHAAHN